MMSPVYKPPLQVDWDTAKKIADTVTAIASAVTACIALATTIKDMRKEETNDKTSDSC